MIDAFVYAERIEPSQILLTTSTAVVSLFVFVAAVCRLRFLHQRLHRAVWVQSYALIAFGSAGIMIECWVYEVRLMELVLLSGVALWIWGSRVSWQNGPPKYLERPGVTRKG